jgi:hypothetical protein
MTPGRTPIRDELRINDGSETPMSESARAEKLRQVGVSCIDNSSGGFADSLRCLVSDLLAAVTPYWSLPRRVVYTDIQRRGHVR